MSLNFLIYIFNFTKTIVVEIIIGLRLSNINEDFINITINVRFISFIKDISTKKIVSLSLHFINVVGYNN